MSEQETLEKAQNLGYVQPDDWKGEPPPGGFKTPEEFLEVGEQNLNLSNADNERLHDEIRGLKDAIASQSESVGVLKDMHEKRVASERKRGYDQAYAKLTEEQSTAIKDQDADAFAASRKRERALEEQQQTENAAATQAAATDTNDALITRFQSENAWFRTDFVLSDTAERASRFIYKTQPNLSSEEHLTAMKKAVQDAHPDHEAFRVDKAPSMDGGGNPSLGGQQGARWQDVPASDKAQFDRFVEDKLFTNDEAGRKEYLELYGA